MKCSLCLSEFLRVFVASIYCENLTPESQSSTKTQSALVRNMWDIYMDDFVEHLRPVFFISEEDRRVRMERLVLHQPLSLVAGIYCSPNAAAPTGASAIQS